MNADQHPALRDEQAELPSLTLVLPAGLGSDQALTGLIQAIADVRSGLAAHTRQFQRLATGYAAHGDQLRQALCRGQALGSEYAASAIDEAIVEIFDLWPQYEAQLLHQPPAPTANAASAPTAPSVAREPQPQIPVVTPAGNPGPGGSGPRSCIE